MSEGFRPAQNPEGGGVGAAGGAADRRANTQAGQRVWCLVGKRMGVFVEAGGAPVRRDHHPTELEAGLADRGVRRVNTDPTLVVGVGPGW